MGYTKEYWEREGPRIAAERRKRYQNDPNYREIARQRARDYRARKKAEEEQKGPPTITVNGVARPAITSDELCARVGIDKARLKYMQKAGYIPAAAVQRPVRLYTERQAELVANMEAFLQEHSAYLRSPQTNAGAAAVTKLGQLTTEITQLWET